jgi:hypothetical protein
MSIKVMQQALDTLTVLMNDESVSYDAWDKAKASEAAAALNVAIIEAEKESDDHQDNK